MSRARLRLLLAMVAAVLAAGVLVQAGTEPLRPPVRSWAAAEAWYERVGPGAVAVAALRLLALAGAGWVLIAAALQLLATSSRGGAVQTIADAASPRALRRLAHGVTGLSITVALAGPPVPSAAGPDPDPAGVAVMEVLDDLEPTTTVPPPAAPPVEAVPAPAPQPEDEVRVAPGDSFWSIAADVVADQPRPVPVDVYWRRLIEANRSRLVDPSNPDLLFPGQVLTLPTPLAP